ncbi:MMPL family transporter [Phytohabitans kaempferiae]|uniref:MMPL family transporter n=1 Tax=Phytohabitans kaempferiae TaxID=1620943 RepID=A0ABV6MAC6_9ACTN
MTRQPTTVRIARWSVLHPWRAILTWLLFVAICVLVGGAVGTRTLTPTEAAVGEWGRAEEIRSAGDLGERPAEHILITARSGTLDATRAQEAATAAGQRLGGLPEVDAVGTAVPSPDGTAMLVQVQMRGEVADAVTNVEPLLRETEAVQQAYPDLRIEQVGTGSINKALGETQEEDFKFAEFVSIPLILIILLVVFGALIAASIPLLLALSAVAAALGLASVTSHLVPTTSSLSSIILLIGLAVGVDYSLFYVRREREERRAGRDAREAVETSAATSGHAVVVSGLAVIVSLAALYAAVNADFSSTATGAILVVAVAVLGSVTVLPAILSKLGRWVDRPRIPLVWRWRERRAATGRSVWSTILRPALRRPAATLTVAVLVLLALAAPALGMKLRLTTPSDLPRSIEIMRSYDRLVAAFPSTGSEHVVAVEGPADRQGEVRTALEGLARRTAVDPLFAHDREPVLRTSADGRVSTLTIGVPANPGTQEAEDSLRALRETLLPSALDRIPDIEYAVSGQTAADHDYVAEMTRDLPLIIAIVLVLTFLVMMITFRSVVVATLSILLNCLSVVAAFGILTAVFQGEWAEGLLGFESNGGVVAWLPLVLFVILFGLSMDYHVFLVSRIREAVLQGQPTTVAVETGIVRSAGVVTSAAVIMVAVVSVFATLTALELKQLGVGLAVAILLDATIIRAVVLPAAMTMLGHRNWWAPRFMRRREETPAEATESTPTERVDTTA